MFVEYFDALKFCLPILIMGLIIDLYPPFIAGEEGEEIKGQEEGEKGEEKGTVRAINRLIYVSLHFLMLCLIIYYLTMTGQEVQGR